MQHAKRFRRPGPTSRRRGRRRRQGDLDVDDREAGEHAEAMPFMPFSTPGCIPSAPNRRRLRLELEARAGLARLDDELDAADWPVPPDCFLWV
jgi:hypothetical protein